MSRPTTNVGIVAMDCYFPAAYVSQAELETANNVSQGKATRLFFLNNGEATAAILFSIRFLTTLLCPPASARLSAPQESTPSGSGR